MSTRSELSSRYYAAEKAVWVFIVALISTHILGVAPNQTIPLLNLEIKNTELFPACLAVLLIALWLYLVFEYKQIFKESKIFFWSGIRIVTTSIGGFIALWVSYPTVTFHTRFSGTSPKWFLAFLVIGTLLGFITSVLVFGALMIRSSEEVKQYSLPRVPNAAKMNFILWMPFILFLVYANSVLVKRAPSVFVPTAGILVAATFLLIVMRGWISNALVYDDKGGRIKYRDQIARLKEAHNFHDYWYMIADKIDTQKEMFDFSKEISPQELQKDLREKVQESAASEQFTKFNVVLLEKVDIEFKPKNDGSSHFSFDNYDFIVKARRRKAEKIRVMVCFDDRKKTRKKMSISSRKVESYAREYIDQCLSPLSPFLHKDFDIHKMISHALNMTVLESLIEETGPILHRLVQEGQEAAVVEVIRRKQTNVNERAAAGWTPLICASAQGYPKIVQILLDAGANPDIPNFNGVTPLMFGARYGNEEICQILLNYKASIDLQDVSGMTALMVAVCCGQKVIVELLLKHGANVSIKTRMNKTAVDIAYDFGEGRIARMIKENMHR